MVVIVIGSLFLVILAFALGRILSIRRQDNDFIGELQIEDLPPSRALRVQQAPRFLQEGRLRSEQNKTTKYWSPFGVKDTKQFREYVSMWGHAPEGSQLFAEWHKALSTSINETHKWRKITSDLSLALIWRQVDFSTDEAREWFSAGLEPSIAKRWKEVGFSASQAPEWSRSGLSPSESWTWSNRGLIKCSDVVAWRNAGGDKLPPMVLFPWISAGFVNRTAVAYQWHDLAVSPSVAIEWHTQVGSPSRSMPWLNTKLSPHEAAQWASEALDPEDAIKLAQSGCDTTNWKDWFDWKDEPAVLKEWKTVKARSVSDAQAWMEIGATSRVAQQWIQNGFTSETARPWLDLNFNPETAKLWASHVTPEVAAIWIHTGIDPEDVWEWAKYQVSPERAKVWRDHGFNKAASIAQLDSVDCSPQETQSWIDNGIPVQTIFEERSRWPISEFVLWTSLGFESHDVAASWFQSGIDPARSLQFYGVGVNCQQAKIYLDAKIKHDEIQSVQSIQMTEDLDLPEAIWRYSIERAGYLRDQNVPIYQPPNGSGKIANLVQFLQCVEHSHCEKAIIVHNSPYLSREMLQALPNARPVQGAIKKFLWIDKPEPLDKLRTADLNESSFLIEPIHIRQRASIFDEVVTHVG